MKIALAQSVIEILAKPAGRDQVVKILVSRGNNSDIDLRTEARLPPSTGFHASYYENPGCGFFQLCGGPVPGADVNVNVTATPWGADLLHFTVDDALEVLHGIRDDLLATVPR